MFNTTTHSFSPLIKPTIRPRSKINGYWKDEFNKVVAQINTARGFILAPSEWLEGLE